MTETFKVEIPIYRETLHVFFGPAEDCIKAQRKDGREEIDIEFWRKHFEENDSEGIYTLGSDTYNILWLEHIPETVHDYSNLVHEIEHAVFYILDSRGLRHTEDSDEAYAYMTSYLFCEIDSYIAAEKEKNNNQNNE